MYDIIAVICYPGVGADRVELYIVWETLSLTAFLHGSGNLSLDFLLRRLYRWWHDRGPQLDSSSTVR